MNHTMIWSAKCLDINKSVTDKLFPLWLWGKKQKIPESENKAKQNWYEFPSASSSVKCLEFFKKMTGF